MTNLTLSAFVKCGKILISILIGSINPALMRLYKETDAFVEKWHGRFMFTLIYITIPCISLPYLIWSFYLYYTTDLGKNAFREPFAFWYYFELELKKNLLNNSRIQ